MPKYLLLLVLCFPLNIFATNACQNSSGLLTCKNAIEEHLVANGSALLKDTAIKKELEINGALTAEHVQFHEVLVNGSADIDDGKVSGRTTVHGTLNAKNSSFQTIYLSSDHSILEKSTALQIIVKKQKPSSVEQKLYLIATQVKGDIIFEKGNGQVYLCKKSKVDGKITGAVVINSCKNT